MNNVWNFMAIMLTMMVFLFFLGFNPVGVSTVLNDVGININSTTGVLEEGDVANSSWSRDLFNTTDGLLVGLGIGSALIVGLFTRTFEWKILLSGFFLAFIIKFLAFGYSIVSLANDTGETWLVAIAATVFLPLTGMFIISIINWFGKS